MADPSTLDALADTILARPPTGRLIVAIAGAPGSGKSTLAEELKARLDTRQPGCADILPMDGYHFDDAVLNARGDRPRKGAPHTFDLDGYGAMLRRLRADTGRDIAVPVFDRSIEIARAGGRIIAGSTRIVLTEGNYLLLDEAGWRNLAPLFDLTVMVQARDGVLEQRLRQRWVALDYPPDAITDKLEANDLPNVRLVLAHSRPADVVVRSDDG